MKLFSRLLNILKNGKKSSRKSLDESKREMLVSQGKNQFEALLKRGLRVPIMIL